MTHEQMSDACDAACRQFVRYVMELTPNLEEALIHCGELKQFHRIHAMWLAVMDRDTEFVGIVNAEFFLHNGAIRKYAIFKFEPGHIVWQRGEHGRPPISRIPDVGSR